MEPIRGTQRVLVKTRGQRGRSEQNARSSEASTPKAFCKGVLVGDMGGAECKPRLSLKAELAELRRNEGSTAVCTYDGRGQVRRGSHGSSHSGDEKSESGRRRRLVLGTAGMYDAKTSGRVNATHVISVTRDDGSEHRATSVKVDFLPGTQLLSARAAKERKLPHSAAQHGRLKEAISLRETAIPDDMRREDASRRRQAHAPLRIKWKPEAPPDQ